MSEPSRAASPSQWERLIELGVAAKARLMRDDPYECGPAMIFEYGHTVGHALELTFGGELSHGDAVAWERGAPPGLPTTWAP